MVVYIVWQLQVFVFLFCFVVTCRSNVYFNLEVLTSLCLVETFTLVCVMLGDGSFLKSSGDSGYRRILDEFIRR